MNLKYSHIQNAQKRIQDYIHRTPILQSQQVNKMLGCEIFFKAENFQKVGAFKARGGCNAIFSLKKDSLDQGVITHSSGNHGAALAWAASLRDVSCTVVIPKNAPEVKKQAVEGYGAKVIQCLPTMAERERTVADEVKATGNLLIHPYDNDEIIAGQGTAVIEMLQQLDSPPDIIMAPIGGGGLLAGTAIGVNAFVNSTNRVINVIGAEPQGANDAWQGFKSGQRVIEQTPNTIADGLRSTVGIRNFKIISEKVDDIVLASEEGIVEAMRLIWMRLKIIVEPSAAVSLAAIMENRELFYGQRIGVIITGGNVNLDALPW